LTNPVNGDDVVLPTLLEVALRQLREGVQALSDSRFPGLRTRHYRLLGFITDEGVRLARIADVSGLSKQALAQALAPLEDGGYVTVLPDPDDRRARTVRRSDRGREVIDALLHMQGQYERRWSAQVGAERWTAARSVLVELFGPLVPVVGEPPAAGDGRPRLR
jgi:DNA-binding MarR family transcriptional regulator